MVFWELVYWVPYMCIAWGKAQQLLLAAGETAMHPVALLCCDVLGSGLWPLSNCCRSSMGVGDSGKNCCHVNGDSKLVTRLWVYLILWNNLLTVLLPKMTEAVSVDSIVSLQ